MGASVFEQGIEWEPLANPWETNLVQVDQANGRFGRLRVLRDEEYGIVAVVEASEHHSWMEVPNIEPGSFHDGQRLVGLSPNGWQTIISQARIHSLPSIIVEGRAPVTATFRAGRVTSERAKHRPTALYVEWFIGRPDTPLTFWRVTERIRHQLYSRTRLAGEPGKPAHSFGTLSVPATQNVETSRDHLLLELDDVGAVRLCLVPEEFGPSWAKGMSIEYAVASGGNRPSESVREGVVEALGFLFGRHPLRIGSTDFDEHGSVVAEEAIEPWGRDVRVTCAAHDAPVVPVFSWDEGSLAESAISPLMNSYLKSRDVLNLGQVVWTLWIAARMPLGFDLPLYAAALETLMTAWFASTNSNSRGVYIPKKKFDRHFAAELAAFAAKAESITNGAPVYRKVGRAYEMGTNARFPVFFDELGLPVGDGERAAIHARNTTAHGGQLTVSPQEQARLGTAYRVLLNRVMLKVLGYLGTYIDYTVPGWPQREIDEQIGFRPTA